ncbi:MAG: LysM peptidoglycan-binding domain-containing protein [Clostridium sp.]|nr:LysM peptidoglycan-binding domain-containing protein [Clostridium sp.]
MRAGDTLYLIAQRFNTTVQAILAANPSIVPERLYIGQVICVPQAQTTCPVGSTTYVIRSGDTLAAIARRFNTTVQALLAANPGIVPERLYIGQVICVPQPASGCPIGTSPYEIKAGDTLANIAARFNIPLRDLLNANPGVVPERLYIGQVICIPQPKAEEPSCPTLNFYVIRRGDTLATIAGIFNVTVQQIINVNPGINPYALYVDQVICIPASPSPTRIVISIATKTLSLYREGRLVRSYPVATGKPTTPTPRGTFTIVNKQINPGGPFGTRWMGLSKPHYGIHGTNNPASIGTAASNGCVRMYNEDVNVLFNQVAVGTVVNIY